MRVHITGSEDTLRCNGVYEHSGVRNGKSCFSKEGGGALCVLASPRAARPGARA